MKAVLKNGKEVISKATTKNTLQKTYQIKFVGNGATSGRMINQEIIYGNTTSIKPNEYSKTGYSFQGWSTDKLTEIKYKNGQQITNITEIDKDEYTLYAIWKKTITIRYNANGGTEAPSTQTGNVFNDTTSMNFTIPSTEPTKEGYTFLGWSSSNTATTATYVAGKSYSFSDNITLYAVWKSDNPVVTFSVEIEKGQIEDDKGQLVDRGNLIYLDEAKTKEIEDGNQIILEKGQNLVIHIDIGRDSVLLIEKNGEYLESHSNAGNLLIIDDFQIEIKNIIEDTLIHIVLHSAGE